MPQSKPPAFPDRLGLVMAHLHMMREGGDCDTLNDEKLFPRRVNNVVGDAQSIVANNFGGDTDLLFRTALYELASAINNGGSEFEALEARFREIADGSHRLYLS